MHVLEPRWHMLLCSCAAMLGGSRSCLPASGMSHLCNPASVSPSLCSKLCVLYGGKYEAIICLAETVIAVYGVTTEDGAVPPGVYFKCC